jgi:hypothetical protein
MNKLKGERGIRNVHICTKGLNMWGTLKKSGSTNREAAYRILFQAWYTMKAWGLGNSLCVLMM